MILKSYEVEKIKSQISNKKICLLYGENLGIKKDIKNSIEITIKKNESTIEKLTLFEDDIIKDPENFYNLIFSGSFGRSSSLSRMLCIFQVISRSSGSQSEPR